MPSAWVRAAAVVVLASWIPCAPLGLCLRATEESAPQQSADHACCPSTDLGMKAAPEQCWLQSNTPTPAATPPTLVQPAIFVVAARPVSAIPNAPLTPIPAFSPLAVVLRI